MSGIRKRNLRAPKINTKADTVINGMFAGINRTIGTHKLLTRADFRLSKKPEPQGAGRGGVHYGKTSSTGMIADTAVKQTRQKREHIPYKPTPQMHALHSIKEMGRAAFRGIPIIN